MKILIGTKDLNDFFLYKDLIILFDMLIGIVLYNILNIGTHSFYHNQPIRSLGFLGKISSDELLEKSISKERFGVNDRNLVES